MHACACVYNGDYRTSLLDVVCVVMVVELTYQARHGICRVAGIGLGEHTPHHTMPLLQLLQQRLQLPPLPLPLRAPANTEVRSECLLPACSLMLAAVVPAQLAPQMMHHQVPEAP